MFYVRFAHVVSASPRLCHFVRLCALCAGCVGFAEVMRLRRVYCTQCHHCSLASHHPRLRALLRQRRHPLAHRATSPTHSVQISKLCFVSLVPYRELRELEVRGGMAATQMRRAHFLLQAHSDEERHTGIEPASSAWEADALPMC